jgi:hypothetical protein
MKIRLFAVGLFHAEQWKDRHMTELIVAFQNLTNTSKN